MTNKKSIANETIDRAVNITEKTASVSLQTAVKTAEVAESYAQGLYKAAYDANIDGLKVARNYWDAATEIRQDWVNLFSTTGERFIKAAANMELPLQKEFSDAARNVLSNIEDNVETFGKQAKAATK